jgi:hypothetical protein
VNTTATDFAINTPFPAMQPPFVDSANSTYFGTYPCPRVDIAFSEAPLPSFGAWTTTSVSFLRLAGRPPAARSLRSC